ncbi:MAG TPA: DUF480 domain-containing protein [Acidimicrobiales bacterium]|nr:DUF480 domain-containing protein [Acidimicrobiales bacterium]
MLLSPEEGRVIGSLIEKQLTTPQQYPLTMNSLVLACNQSSNREPVVEFDERTVDSALTSLKSAGLVRFVHPSHGRSVIRYRQVLEEQLALGDTELALLGVLLLRGPQTAGELRARTERMAQFEGMAAVDSELERLVRRPDPLVRKLARRPGQKEERWVQLLAGDDLAVATVPGPALGPDRDDDHRGAGAGDRETLTGGSPLGASPGRLAALEEEVAELRDEVKQLRSDLDDLRTQLGS